MPEAVRCADSLAKRNHLTEKMENICGKCEEVLPALIPELKEKFGKITLILDPPRKGADASVVRAALRAEADKIVYVSCNPATLARDVGLLIGSLTERDGAVVKAEAYEPRYSIEYIRPYDFFPQTKHVETLVLLSKKSLTVIS